MSTVSVRYIVDDVDAAIAFYRDGLGFREEMHPAPAFAMLSRGDLRLVLSRPGPGPGGGGQAMPDGRMPQPGGWNRFSIEVGDLDATIAALRESGARFRNDVVTGVGGRQILVEDPSGNPVELFEPTLPEARLARSGEPPGEVTSWHEFAAADPELATTGRRLLERSGVGEAFLATVRGDAPPRIHPINVAVVDGRLLAYLIVGSAKLADLDANGRYALHAHQDPAEPHEFQLRGHAREVADPAIRHAAAAAWPFAVDDGYRLVEFSIEHAVLGERADPDAWPPRYRSWRRSS
jgi:catechol 2,3-dioxygenase-like lactoylglutathione lyase family enzyme